MVCNISTDGRDLKMWRGKAKRCGEVCVSPVVYRLNCCAGGLLWQRLAQRFGQRRGHRTHAWAGLCPWALPIGLGPHRARSAANIPNKMDAFLTLCFARQQNYWFTQGQDFFKLGFPLECSLNSRSWGASNSNLANASRVVGTHSYPS